MDDQIRPKREKPFRLRPARSPSGARIWVLEVNGTGAPLACDTSVRGCLEMADRFAQRSARTGRAAS